MLRDETPSGADQTRAAMGLALAMFLAAVVRSLGLEQVFLDDDTVVFALGDAFYHARRALFSFERFPDFLAFDACINHPDGSVIPHPFGLDWAVGGLARVFGDSLATFERVSAWTPVVWGTLTLIPIYLLGVALGGRWVGLGAACFYAVLPITAYYAQVGNVDHHAAAGFLGAVLLWLYVIALDERRRGRALIPVFGGLALARSALLLVWHGGPLYLVLGEVALVVAASALMRRDWLACQAGSALLTAALLLPVVVQLPTPNGGPFSATELSHLHLLALVAIAVLCAGGLAWERVRPSRSSGSRLMRLSLLSLGVAGALLLEPGVQEGAARALAFLGKRDAYTELVLEQLPIFYEQGGYSLAAAERRMAWFVYLVPLVPVVFASRDRPAALRSGLLLLFAWSLLFGYLALGQLRYAHDFAAAGCVGFAVLIQSGHDWLRARGVGASWARVAVIATGVLLAAPSVPRIYADQVKLTWAYLSGELKGSDRALLSIQGSQLRFAQTVRRLTPTTPGCDASRGAPRYGILAHPAIGHVLHYTAKRATPADPFGPYIGRENYAAVRSVLELESEAEVLQIAERLRTPYLLTAEEGGQRPAAVVVQRLQRQDGTATKAHSHLEHFRLVAEGPLGGVPISLAWESQLRSPVAYKLFEIVPGAVLEVPAAPGETVSAALPIVSSIGRVFRFEARDAAGADGLARVRVPYPTGALGPTRTRGPYRVIAGNKRWLVHVPERAVRQGATVRAGPPTGRLP